MWKQRSLHHVLPMWKAPGLSSQYLPVREVLRKGELVCPYLWKKHWGDALSQNLSSFQHSSLPLTSGTALSPFPPKKHKCKTSSSGAGTPKPGSDLTRNTGIHPFMLQSCLPLLIPPFYLPIKKPNYSTAPFSAKTFEHSHTMLWLV